MDGHSFNNDGQLQTVTVARDSSLHKVSRLSTYVTIKIGTDQSYSTAFCLQCLMFYVLVTDLCSENVKFETIFLKTQGPIHLKYQTHELFILDFDVLSLMHFFFFFGKNVEEFGSFICSALEKFELKYHLVHI